MMRDSSSPSVPISELREAQESPLGGGDAALDRRGFFGEAVRGAGTAALAAGAGCTLPVRSMRASAGVVVEVPIDRFPELAKTGGRVKVITRDMGAVFVSEDGHGGYRGVSAKCTHLGCDVVSAGAGFRCPCHGSRFSDEGQVLVGPANGHLLRFAATRRGNVVVLRLDRTV